ncbi:MULTISPECIES: hypothetical protein [Salinicola]|uniref:hypothetical protein n=1 Tax=Salinicola TaxID=404432 RepID=UPI001E3B4B59|nr:MULTISPECIES: hypothetical protein [Salinicola]
MYRSGEFSAYFWVSGRTARVKAFRLSETPDLGGSDVFIDDREVSSLAVSLSSLLLQPVTNSDMISQDSVISQCQ